MLILSVLSFGALGLLHEWRRDGDVMIGEGKGGYAAELQMF